MSNSTIVMLDCFRCLGVVFDPILQLFAASVVCPLPMFPIRESVVIVPPPFVERLAVSKSQYSRIRITVLVLIDSVDASFPSHPLLTIVPRSPLQRTG